MSWASSRARFRSDGGFLPAPVRSPRSRTRGRSARGEVLRGVVSTTVATLAAIARLGDALWPAAGDLLRGNTHSHLNRGKDIFIGRFARRGHKFRTVIVTQKPILNNFSCQLAARVNDWPVIHFNLIQIMFTTS